MSAAACPTVVLYNPGARHLAADGAAESLAELVGSVPGSRAVRLERPESLQEVVAATVAGGCERLFAAGGDGTLNAVVNAAGPWLAHVAVGLIPLGTGNDFARTLGLPLERDGVRAMLAEGAVRRLDVLRVRSRDGVRLCVNVANGGFSGEVDEALDDATKQTWGPLAYLRAALRALPELTAYRARLRFDDEPPVSLPVYNVLVANGRYVGGGVPVAPEAEPDDGLADVVVLPALPMSEILALVPALITQAHHESDSVLFRRVRRFRMSARPPLPFNADGEPLGRGAVDVLVRPRRLRFIVPGPR